MTYSETIEFLFSSLPMFQRIGDAAIKKDLTNIRLLCDILDRPHEHFPAIHVAGTNGKGSTSHMLASVFQAAGKKVGLYTSPHYIDFRERIKINGRMISKTEVIAFVEKYRQDWKPIQPSFFEITVAMAFHHFRKKKVDIAIIETGLGGRLDSTNIIQPKLSVITNIGYDHMQMLGHTLPEIAAEKAGIIKNKVPVVIGEWQHETFAVFKEKALAEQSPIFFASRHIKLEKKREAAEIHSYIVSARSGNLMKTIQCDLTGPYQEKNIKTVLESLFVWNQTYPSLNIRDKFIRHGLKNVRSSTSMIGRWMVLNRNPLVISDAAHNIDGFKTIVPVLLKLKIAARHFVLGFVSDKDIKKILSLFPKDAYYYWCSPAIPRGKAAMEVMEEGRRLNLSGKSYPGVMQAFRAALLEANGSDLIFVGGSSYVVGDFLAGKPYSKKESLQ